MILLRGRGASVILQDQIAKISPYIYPLFLFKILGTRPKNGCPWLFVHFIH